MRLIYADKLIQELEKNKIIYTDEYEEGRNTGISWSIEEVVDAPTVDAIPVIRCKDCKFSSPNGVYGCRIKSFADDIDKRLYSDDFCSRAERK